MQGLNGEAEVRQLYSQMLAGWNTRSGEVYAGSLARDAEVIGFDGSIHRGREAVASQMNAIFKDHQTAKYVSVVKSVRTPTSDTVILRAAVGMISPGASNIRPEMNAWHTVIAVRNGDDWRIELFQNTPARFDGRPDEVKKMTAELQEAMGDDQSSMQPPQ